MSLRLVNWNVQWATTRSPRTPEILRRIAHHSAEVVCLTETHPGLLSPRGLRDLLAGRLRLRDQGRPAQGRALVDAALGARR